MCILSLRFTMGLFVTFFLISSINPQSFNMKKIGEISQTYGNTPGKGAVDSNENHVIYGNHGSVHLIDISHPEQPLLVADLPYGDYACLDKNRIYTKYGDYVSVFDLANPVTALTSFSIGTLSNIRAQGGLLFAIRASGETLRCIDARDLSHITFVSVAPCLNNPQGGTRWAGAFLHVASLRGSIFVDVSRPYELTPVSHVVGMNVTDGIQGPYGHFYVSSRWGDSVAGIHNCSTGSQSLYSNANINCLAYMEGNLLASGDSAGHVRVFEAQGDQLIPRGLYFAPSEIQALIAKGNILYIFMNDLPVQVIRYNGPPNPQPLLNAAIVSHTIPNQLSVGQVRTVQVTVRNTGLTAWAPWDISLAIVKDDENLLNQFIPRVGLPADLEVPPNESFTFTFQLKGSNAPLTSKFSVQMVHEFVEFFGERIDQSISIGSPGTLNLKNTARQWFVYN